MKNKDIPYYKVSLRIDNNLKNSLRNGWLTTGPKVKEFEDNLKSYTGAKNAIAVNSCTAGLHLSLAAQNISKEDYVIVPNLTFVATSEVVEYFGANLLLCDIDPKTLCLDINLVEEAAKKLKGKLKFVMPVHFAGYAADMKSLLSLSEKYGFKIIEDCAHSLETFSNIGKVGNANNCSVFSFYANKNITTGGEGGAVLTNDDFLAGLIRKLSLHGMSKDAWNRFSKNGKWYYEVDSLGYKYNLTDIAAGFGIQQMKKIDQFSQKRQLIALKYDQILSPIPGIKTFNYDTQFFHARHLYIIHLSSKKWSISRDDVIQFLNSNGIGTSVHYIPLHRMPYYKNKYNLSDKNFPHSVEYFKGCISLPIYPSLKLSEVNYIGKVISQLAQKYVI